MQSSALTDESVGLRDVSPFPIGTAVHLDRAQANPALLDLIAKHFSSVTAEIDMKMHVIAKEPGIFDFAPADRMLEFAQARGQRLFGHTLIWHSGTPDWVKALASDARALDRFMQEYIGAYVGRYKGKVAGWDVANEALNTAGGGYRESVWRRALGDDYIAKAFSCAHEADPDATLFYNDFNIERDREKLDSALAMIESLRKRGAPISGLGFQMHLRMDVPDETIAESLRKGAATGLQIHLSEVDLIFNRHNDSQGGGEQVHRAVSDEMRGQQAEKYRRLASMYRGIVPEAQQYGITFWGANDGDSWIKSFFGIEDWPCLFDEQLQPKPALFGFQKGLTEEVE